MIIASDVDEVLVKLIERFAEFHDDTYYTNTASDQLAQMTTYNFEEIYGGTRTEIAEKIRGFFATGYSIDIQPVNGAQETIALLSPGNTLVAITARPYFTGWVTERSLGMLYPGKFSSVHLTNQWHGEGERINKSEVCKKLSVEWIIEDSLRHAYDCVVNGVKVVLLDRPWNQQEKLPRLMTRAYSHAEVPAIILGK